MNLEQIVDRTKYSGIVVVPDLHDNIRALVDVIRMALAEDLFVLSIGDLIDSEEKGFPQQVVEAMTILLDSEQGALVIGNHDDKYIRLAKGNPVTMSQMVQDTLAKTTSQKYFLDMFTKISNHSNSGYYGYYGNTFFFHAASHVGAWEKPEIITSAQRARFIYGHVNGKRDATGFPVRLYDWVEEVPEAVTVFVGHDRRPMGHALTGKQPMLNTNANGGKVFFMDTGSGKGGHLTTAILRFAEHGLSFEGFRKF